MGTQQRSRPHHRYRAQDYDGLIGRAYFASAGTAATRKSIDLERKRRFRRNWIGICGRAAPRRPYKDNVQPYNWHWFKIWAPGDALNNGTTSGLWPAGRGRGLAQPRHRVGGRYPSRTIGSFTTPWSPALNMTTRWLAWEGTCCQGMKYYNRSRGRPCLGTKAQCWWIATATKLRPERKKTNEFKAGTRAHPRLGGARLHDRCTLCQLHRGHPQRRGSAAPVAVGNVAVTMLQLSTLPGSEPELHLDSADGKSKATRSHGFVGREYEKLGATQLKSTLSRRSFVVQRDGRSAMRRVRRAVCAAQLSEAGGGVSGPLALPRSSCGRNRRFLPIVDCARGGLPACEVGSDDQPS